MFLDINYIIGEAIILLVGSITAIIMTVKNGLWGKSNSKSSAKNDIIISGVMSLIFSCVATFLIYKFTNDIQRAIIFAIGFFFIIYIMGFVVLRTLAFLSNKRKQQTK